jgi:hypothetical protein
MPQEIQNGLAVVFGIKPNGDKIAISGYAGVILEDVKITHKNETDTIRDENNATTTKIYTDGHKEVDINFVPSAADAEGSKDSAYDSAIFIPPGAKVLLTGFKVNPGPGETNWNEDPWVREGDQTLTLSHKEAKLTLKVRQYDDRAQNDMMCNTVS